MTLPPGPALRAAPDLGRISIGFKARDISAEAGLRGALAVGAMAALAEYLGWPPMIEAVLAALFTCLCDPGGRFGNRLPRLAAFVALGSVIVVLVPLLRGLPPPLAALAGAAIIFIIAFARCFGEQWAPFANLLAVVVLLALDHPLSLAAALGNGAGFLIGGAWTLLLVMLFWRLRPNLPARRATERAYRALAAFAADLQDLLGDRTAGAAQWEAHARAHRRLVREAIEDARETMQDVLRRQAQGAAVLPALQLRLEAADQVFGALIALTDMLEFAPAPAIRARAARLLRPLAPLLSVLAEAAARDAAPRPQRLLRSLDGMAAQARSVGLPDTLAAVVLRMIERLRIAATLATPAYLAPGGLPAGRTAPPRGWRFRLGPIIAHLNAGSPILRHALRMAVLVFPALLVTISFGNAYAHWLTITLVVVLQPYFATSWQRVLERVAGTVLGGVVAALLSVLLHGPTGFVLAMLPLAFLCFALRPASYPAMILCMTPMIVLILELAAPGGSELMIAGARILFTLAGGGLAMAGLLVLWPSWEPARLRHELARAIAAHAVYASAELSCLLGETPQSSVEQARRAAGRASNALEASISRALLEPRGQQRGRLDAALVCDAALRRLAGRLSVLQLSPDAQALLDSAGWRAWRAWFAESLRAVAEQDRPVLNPRPSANAPATDAPEMLARMARQIELMAGALARED